VCGVQQGCMLVGRVGCRGFRLCGFRCRSDRQRHTIPCRPRRLGLLSGGDDGRARPFHQRDHDGDSGPSRGFVWGVGLRWRSPSIIFKNINSNINNIIFKSLMPIPYNFLITGIGIGLLLAFALAAVICCRAFRYRVWIVP
jgi:hypothetical protein